MSNTFTKEEKFSLSVLAGIQFLSVLDFIIIMPLGPQFLRVFSISPEKFGYIVSSYTLSAAILGFIGAFFIDRFDRKKSLLILFSGFLVGTFLCGISSSYIYLLISRLIAGAFGGLMGATIFSILGDLIVPERRGRATGLIMSGFALASVLGVPLGLKLANVFNWKAPFLFVALLGIPIIYFISKFIPNLNSHLKTKEENNNFLKNISELILKKNHLIALALTMSLTLSGFTIIPYIAQYMVYNTGLNEKDLPIIYLVGGFCTLFSANYSGKLSDKYGKRKIFIIMACISAIAVYTITNMEESNLYMATLITSFFMIAITGRVIPSMAMITGSVESKYRGGFMSLNSCTQNLASAIAASLSGLIIVKTPEGLIKNFNVSGYICIAMTVTAILISLFLKYEEKASD